MRRQRDRLLLIGILLLAAALSAPSVRAQSSGRDEDTREHAFVEALRREDAAAAERYLALRDAHAQAVTELRKVEAQYNAAGPELRALFVRALRQARANYAETSLALLDFFDARDRGTLVRYQEEIARINAALEERGRTRAELEKLRVP